MKKRIIPFVPKEERAKLNEGCDDTKINYNIVGDNGIKKVFKIPIGNIPDEEIKDYIRKIAEKFKKANQQIADLDCGIYPNVYHEDELNLLTNPNKMQTNYMHVIPNSHFWTDLNQILYSIQHELDRQKRELEVKDNNSIYIGEPLTADYIVIGLYNSLTHGYRLKQKEKPDNGECSYESFKSIIEMIKYVQSQEFTLEKFYNLIDDTIKNGLNLTNGLKMERKDVYKCIDVERNYQDIVGKSGQRGDIPDEEKPVSEWVNYVEYHLSKAKDEVYHLRKDNALEELRKIAALAVRAMEIHGCPERRMPDRIGNITVNKDGTTCNCDDGCECKK